jgi:hypothetical protein
MGRTEANLGDVLIYAGRGRKLYAIIQKQKPERTHMLDAENLTKDCRSCSGVTPAVHI